MGRDINEKSFNWTVKGVENTEVLNKTKEIK